MFTLLPLIIPFPFNNDSVTAKNEKFLSLTEILVDH